jgi:hypothetical protein
MTTRPACVAQTSRETQRQYKKHGPQLSDRQMRQLERAFELDQRAVKTRALEEKRQAAKRKRQEKERKEREARRQLGIGLATQLVGYSHTQKRLKSGMEAFLGVARRQQEEEQMKEAEVKKKLEAIADAIENEPWDDEDEHILACDLRGQVFGGDSLFDDGLDDDTLLEVHNVVMSDAPTHVPETTSKKLPPPVPVEPASSPKFVEDAEFLRLHGPINKAIEKALEPLPEPLIELLSVDHSLNQPAWNPPPSLLHKLSPVGLPPHRLRIKIGCILSLLRDLNSSSQLSKSSHLRVLRFENERLECLVLDGQLEGTKTILTRVTFCARYKNEPDTPFQRFQYPVRVSPTFIAPKKTWQSNQSFFKLPTVAGHSTKPVVSSRKPSLPNSRTKSVPNPNPGFKLPGLPASKTMQPESCATPTAPITLPLDDWGEFLDSGTQIARELSSNKSTDQTKTSTKVDHSLPISTQDFELTFEDLDELFLSQVNPHKPITNIRPVKESSPAEPPTVQSKPVTPKTARLAAMTLSQSREAPPIRPETQADATHMGLDTTTTLINTASAAIPLKSLSELGLSTQEAISFFEDEFSSPTITL